MLIYIDTLICVADNWSLKAKRRTGAQGTGRMKHLKTMPRRFKNGFRENSTAPAKKQVSTS